MKKKTLKTTFKDIKSNVDNNYVLVEKDWDSYKEDLSNSFIILTTIDECIDWNILDFIDPELEDYIIHIIIASSRNKTYTAYLKELIQYY